MTQLQIRSSVVAVVVNAAVDSVGSVVCFVLSRVRRVNWTLIPRFAPGDLEEFAFCSSLNSNHRYRDWAIVT